MKHILIIQLDYYSSNWIVQSWNTLDGCENKGLWNNLAISGHAKRNIAHLSIQIDHFLSSILRISHFSISLVFWISRQICNFAGSSRRRACHWLTTSAKQSQLWQKNERINTRSQTDSNFSFKRRRITKHSLIQL
jgi:hypothetical protein